MKKIANKVFLFGLLLLALISMSGCKSGVDLKAEFELGYDGEVKISKGNPIRAKLNNMGKGFSGEIRVKVDQNGSEAILFTKPFDIAENSEKELEMLVPIYTLQKQFVMEVTKGNKVIYSQTIKPKGYISPEETVVAVITDQPDSYRFFNGISLPKYNVDSEFLSSYNRSYNNMSGFSNNQYTTETIEESVKVHTLYFDSFDVFAEKDNFDYMDYIYIGKSSQLNIDSEVESYLRDWLKEGNTLFIETGKDYKKIISQLPTSLQNIEITGFEDKSIDGTTDVDSNNMATFVKGNIIESFGGDFVNVGDQAFGVATGVGSGSLVTLLVDMSMKPWDDGSASSLLTNIFATVDADKVQKPYDDSNYYYYRGDLNTIPVEKSPPYIFMIIIFVVYIVIAGPILYAIYKHRDKRDRLWIAVPASAAVCLLILYVVGFATRYDKPIMNSISRVTYEEGDEYMKVESNIALFNNKKSDITISWNESQDIQFNFDGNNYGDYRENKKLIGKSVLGKDKSYTIYDTPLWNASYMSANKFLPFKQSEDTKVMQMGQGDILNFDVTNPTPLDLEYAFLRYGNQYFAIGQLKANETVHLTEADAYMGDDYSFFDKVLAPDIYMYYDKESRRKQNELEVLRDQMNMYNEMNSYEMDTNNISANLFGFNRTSIGYDIDVNGEEVESFNRSIVAIKCDVSYEKGDYVKMPYGSVEAQVQDDIDGEGDVLIYKDYDFDFQVADIYDRTQVEIEWSIPSMLEVEEVTMKIDKIFREEDYFHEVYYRKSYEEIGYEDGYYIDEGETCDASFSVYNYEKEIWETVTLEDEILTTMVDLKKEYVDNGHIRLQFQVVDPIDYTRMKLPTIEVKGVAK